MNYGEIVLLLFKEFSTPINTQILYDFFFQESGKLVIQAPPLTDEDFNKPVGRFSQSIFQAGTSRALTATSIGNLVVWDTVRPKFQRGKKTNYSSPREAHVLDLTCLEKCVPVVDKRI